MRSIGVIVTFLSALFLIAHEAECLMVVLDPPVGKRQLNMKSKISKLQQDTPRQDDWKMRKYSKLYQRIKQELSKAQMENIPKN